LKTSDDDRLADYLDQVALAAGNAVSFIDGMVLDEFLVDTRTQQAVVMSLMIVGEAAAKILDRYPEFAASNAELPWVSMRGMRNRIAHGYFELNLGVVWETAKTALPALLQHLKRTTS
jgi:uncharacterized protein with HEPN domain